MESCLSVKRGSYERERERSSVQQEHSCMAVWPREWVSVVGENSRLSLGCRNSAPRWLRRDTRDARGAHTWASVSVFGLAVENFRSYKVRIEKLQQQQPEEKKSSWQGAKVNVDFTQYLNSD